MPLRSSLASRLKAFSPPQLALVALGSIVLAGAGTAAAAGLLSGALARDAAFTGGDQDLARGAIIEGSVTRPPARTQQSAATPVNSGSRNARPSGADGLRNAGADSTSGNAVAPAAAGGGAPSGAGGPSGNTGGAGPSGNTGAAGPKGDAGTGSETGAPGPKGDTGSGGPTGGPSPNPTADAPAPAQQGAPGTAAAPAAPAVFVVKDAAGTTAGTLVGEDPSAVWLTFSFKERAFVANAQTGALDLPKIDTSYVTDDCTGTPYAPLSRPAKSVLRSANPNETGIYEFGQPGSVDVRSIWQPIEGEPGDCLQYVYTNTELAPLRELSASDRPPVLNGPLKAVRAG